MVRYIKSAEQPSIEDKFGDAVDKLEDDFDFVVTGINKLAADGDFGKAMELVSGLSEMINASIEEMAEAVSSAE